jgi:hypothetical protein
MQRNGGINCLMAGLCGKACRNAGEMTLPIVSPERLLAKLVSRLRGSTQNFILQKGSA